jgi:FdhD protein
MIERPPSQTQRDVVRFRDNHLIEDEDVVAAEEPLEIRLLWDKDGSLQRKSIAITMRTPGYDFELAAGFLFGEGIIKQREDVVDVSYCTDEVEEQAYNIVNVTLRPGLAFDIDRLERNFYTTSSCGVCGKAALETLEVQGCEALPVRFQVDATLICRLPDTLRQAQLVFERTGGLHAAGLFDQAGTLLGLREDVGRHNAVDKLIGEQLLAGAAPLDNRLLLLSGRASFELVQKALVARIPLIASVGAPSSLAVDLAISFGLTLIGFVRGESFNVYSGVERLSALTA